MLDISNNHDSIENVLIFQGGGSLGAFGCGVFKGFADNDVEVDITAGTSIGGINAAILAGTKDDHPEKALEEFWLEIAENSIDCNPIWRWVTSCNGKCNKVRIIILPHLPTIILVSTQ